MSIDGPFVAIDRSRTGVIPGHPLPHYTTGEQLLAALLIGSDANYTTITDLNLCLALLVH